jgi:soluble lytic murein transglycosylase-like protein
MIIRKHGISRARASIMTFAICLFNLSTACAHTGAVTVNSDTDAIGAKSDTGASRKLASALRKKGGTLSTPQRAAIASAIMRESTRYGFDPFMIASVIKIESDFSIMKYGSHGEVGLMQIKPATGRWIAERSGLSWEGSKTLLDPVKNIQLGAAYLAFLRETFSTQQLYLSAYNMGAANVRKALRMRTIPVKYSSRVLAQYRAFYLLARAPEEVALSDNPA